MLREAPIRVTPLLSDVEYYVQMDVGWTLCELHNVYPGQALNYLKENLLVISSMALTMTAEKMDAEMVKGLRDRRK